jgi:formylglycine-generating enzyme required for sulfatase activity
LVLPNKAHSKLNLRANGNKFVNVCNGPPGDASQPKPLGARDTGSYPGCVGGLTGLYDMSGNLQEWVDHCDDYSCLTVGGSFANSWVSDLTCGSDEHQSTGVTKDWPNEADGKDIGFRCCLSLE